MPLLENDVIFAFLNEYDPNHAIAERIFQKLQNGEISVEISSVSLIEMELIYRSEKMEDKLLKDLAAIAALPHVKYVTLTPDVAVASVYLRQTLNLTFFDSHYAATALNLDRKVISFDKAYDMVPGLTRIKPGTFNFKEETEKVRKLLEKVKPSERGFAAKSVREDRESH